MILARPSSRFMCPRRRGPHCAICWKLSFRMFVFLKHHAPKPSAPRHKLKGPVCIHGHFNAARSSGIDDYYPAADQFMSVVREPFETLVSNLFLMTHLSRAQVTPLLCRSPRFSGSVTALLSMRQVDLVLVRAPAFGDGTNADLIRRRDSYFMVGGPL